MGARLHVESEGRGPGIVWHHGFGGSARNFRPQVRSFRDERTVVTYDARGHARSEAPVEPDAYTIDALSADLHQVCTRFGDEAVAIGGLSMGAAVALEYASRFPARVSGLVLAALPPGDAGRAWALSFADAIDEVGVERAGARFVWGGERFDASAQDLIRRGFLEHPPHALAATLRGTLARLPPEDEVVARVRALRCPVRVVVGEGDAPSLGISRRLAAELPDVGLEVIGGAGHVVNLQAPAAFNAVVTRFLNDSGI